MCGDSTVKENVEKLMDGKKADEVITDPPYNTGMQEKVGVPASTRLKHMFNDKLTKEQFETLIVDGFENMLDNTKGDAVFYVFID
jgi:DNA modification methylase